MMKRWTAIFLSLLTGWSVLAAQPPAPVLTVPPTGEVPCHFLIVVETSSLMSHQSDGVRKTVYNMIVSGMNGHMKSGQRFAIWTFNDKVYSDRFPVQTWSPEINRAVALRSFEMLRKQPFEKKAELDVMMREVNRIAAALGTLNVVIVTEGSNIILGTPFDRKINTFYGKHYDEFRKVGVAFVTTLVARGGEFQAWAVNAGDDRVFFPPIDAPSKASNDTEKPKVTSEAVPAPKPQIPPLVLPPTSTATLTPLPMKTNQPPVATPPKTLIIRPPPPKEIPKPETTTPAVQAPPPVAVTPLSPPEVKAPTPAPQNPPLEVPRPITQTPPQTPSADVVRATVESPKPPPVMAVAPPAPKPPPPAPEPPPEHFSPTSLAGTVPPEHPSPGPLSMGAAPALPPTKVSLTTTTPASTPPPTSPAQPVSVAPPPPPPPVKMKEEPKPTAIVPVAPPAAARPAGPVPARESLPPAQTAIAIPAPPNTLHWSYFGAAIALLGVAAALGYLMLRGKPVKARPSLISKTIERDEKQP